MNREEDEHTNSDSPGLPSLPPFPDFMFANVSQSAKFLNVFEDNESSILEKAIARVLSAERYFYPKPFFSINTYIKSQLQEGPKCGLVAVSIATSITDNFKSTDELFAEAVSKGFTTQGEMYSTENLATLVETCTQFKTFVLDSGLNSHINCIFQCIQNGGLMLVPYDADCNHSPCCKRGHHAHWAVMSGLVIFKLHDMEENEWLSLEEGAPVMTNPDFYPSCQCLENDNGKFFNPGPQEVKIFRRDRNVYFIKNEEDLQNIKKCKIYLAGKHGKSRNLALWPFEALAESNNNLIELSDQQRVKNFILPDGGISSGLKGKAILLNLPK